MTDTILKSGDGTAEAVAFKLFQSIAIAENKKVFGLAHGMPADKDWILKTYAECLSVVWNPRQSK